MLEMIRRSGEQEDEMPSMLVSARERLGMEKPDGSNPGVGKVESVLEYGAAIATTFLVRRALNLGWRKALDREPPKNPASPAVNWKDALLFGAVSGALVGMARIGSRRASTAAYRRIRR